MADWSRPFFDPIELPDGRVLHTLRDAANYITKLPAEEHDLPHWQTAMQVLLLSAEHGQAGADPFFAWLAMTQAIWRGSRCRVGDVDRDAAAQAGEAIPGDLINPLGKTDATLSLVGLNSATIAFAERGFVLKWKRSRNRGAIGATTDQW